MQSEYLEFVEEPTPPDRKTGIWQVCSRSSGAILGRIKWYGAWRQFCFFPEPLTIFNTGCMDDISEFIAERMEARRLARSGG